MAEATGKCAHKNCDCPPEEGSKYCCEYCEEADRNHVTDIFCACAHRGCQG
jgi:hypothetical protein